MLADLPLPLLRPLYHASHLWFRFARPLTMGVRAVVLDEADRVFLVRHSYLPGWHLPGGGVEVGETALEALARELREEGHIELTGAPVLHGVYLNTFVTKRDHVLIYVVRDFQQHFFARLETPPGHSLQPATRARRGLGAARCRRQGRREQMGREDR